MSSSTKKFKKRGININSSTVGHIDHGKTSLTSAITFEAGQFKAYGEIDSGVEEQTRGITINAAHVWFQTEKRVYVHVDCPGHVDYIKNMIVGASQVDIAILVVSITDGVMPQTREHLRLIGSIGVPSVVVFFNKMDMVDPDDILVELVIQETMDLVATYGYKDAKYVTGSAVKALEEAKAGNGAWTDMGRGSIKNLLKIIDELPVRSREIDQPFLMQVEDVVTITGRGTVATGRVIKGKILPNTEVEILGNLKGKNIKTFVTSIHMFHDTVPFAESGDDTGLLLRGVERKDIHRGCVISIPGTIQAHSWFEAMMMINSKEEGGRSRGFGLKYKPQFFIHASDVTGSFTAFQDGLELIAPGEHAQVSIKLEVPQALLLNDTFIVREGRITVAVGRIIKIFK